MTPSIFFRVVKGAKVDGAICEPVLVGFAVAAQFRHLDPYIMMRARAPVLDLNFMGESVFGEDEVKELSLGLHKF